MLEADISLLKQAAYEAADIAKHHWRGSYQTWDKAEGAGPVTEADLAIDAQLRTTLRRARPDYGWLSEETEDDAARLSTTPRRHKRLWHDDVVEGDELLIVLVTDQAPRDRGGL